MQLLGRTGPPSSQQLTQRVFSRFFFQRHDLTAERAAWIEETETQGGVGAERHGEGRWKGGEAEAEAEVGLEGAGAEAKKEEEVEVKKGKGAGVEEGA